MRLPPRARPALTANMDCAQNGIKYGFGFRISDIVIDDDTEGVFERTAL